MMNRLNEERLSTVWKQISDLMPRYSAILDVLNQAGGSCLSGDPIQRLKASKLGKRVSPVLRTLTAQELKVFRARSQVCEAEMQAKQRFLLVGNITIPVTILFLINQVMPGGIYGLIESFNVTSWLDGFEQDFMLAVLGVTFAASFYFILYATAAIDLYRTLKNLIELELTERGEPSLLADAEQDNEETELEDDGIEVA